MSHECRPGWTRNGTVSKRSKPGYIWDCNECPRRFVASKPLDGNSFLQWSEIKPQKVKV